ncbi:MAG TPA: FHA domain-containing protein [Ktedonobacteraceae bacterium]|nr:FHA domain-containing protein [Ktedonobacteraceae bacterium]
MDKCPYCSAETRPGDNFCLNCGNRLVPSSPSPQQAEPAYGDATIPASEDWVTPVPEASPASHMSTSEADENLQTIANPSQDPAFSSDSTVFSGASAPVAQAVIDKVENPAHLILRTDTGEVLQEYPLEKVETIIGRAPTSDILLSKDKLTSRRHATVKYENGSYVIVDERSANGTFVNGQQLEEMSPRTLRDGDHIGIGEHELVFQANQSESSGADIESYPTITVSPSAVDDITYRTQEDELLTAAADDEFSTRSMNGGESASSAEAVAEPVAPAEPAAPVAPVASNDVAPASVNEVEVSSAPPVTEAPVYADSSSGVTFSRLTNLPQPALPDVAPLMAALATLDGQVSSLQERLNATQESMRHYEADIAQTSNQLRDGVRRVSERMDNTIADVARNREQLAWTDLIQLMEDVMNNPRDIEYVTKLARKARELNKVFQIHQNVLNTLAECTSLLRSLLGEEK